MKIILKKILPEPILEKYRSFRKYRTNQYYRKYGVECPICNSVFKNFGSYGIVKRENALCHKCGSLERHRLLWKFINENLDFLKPNAKICVLHFAPENMFYDYFDGLSMLEYVPCDLFPEEYMFEGKSKTQKVDITKIPFENDYFDLIICNHVLEHIPDDRLAMTELYRVMKKDGQGIFQVPIDINRDVTYEDFSIMLPREREKAFGQHDHVRVYGLDYSNKLMHAGFNVKQDEYVKKFTSSELKRYGLIPSEVIYHCSKK
jgi:hypothetical protein